MMFPLMLSSILALAIVFERSWVLRQSRAVPRGLVISLVHDLQSGCFDENNRRKYLSSPLGNLLVNVLHNTDVLSRKRLATRLEAEGKTVVSDLYKHLNLLGTIAAIAPLLGLLGTVLGMIDVFSVIMESGTGQAQPLAGGISEALVSTATGLSVGIPALFFSRHLHRRVEVITLKLEEASGEFLELLLPEGTV